MTDTGPVRPRRALGPLPSDDEAGPASSGGSRALPFDPDWTPSDTETQVLRRVMPGPSPADAGSPASPDSPLQPVVRSWAPTPVPPPMPVPPKPVLPETTASLQASAGRRFSASAEPSEFAPAAPRRSATSVSSPPLVEFDPPLVARPAIRPPAAAAPVAAAPAVVAPKPEQPASVDEATPTAPRRSRGRALGVLAAVLAIAGGVAGSVWWLGPQATPPSTPSNSPSPSAGLDPLLTPADLGRLGGTTWLVDSAPASPPASAPVCLPAGVETMPVADRTAPRVLAAQSAPARYVIHVVETYADPVAARQAYAARLLQAGTCADTEALIVGTRTVSGLANAAFASYIQVQAETPEHHSLVVSQTGRNLSLIDVVSAEPIDLAETAKVAAKPLARLCSGGEGVCPTTVSLTASIPAAGEYPGWLIEADLPRITAGAGRWGATRPSPSLTILGSQCEAVSLVKVSDATSSAQRTLLLADDPSAPTGFGIDQVVYSFPSGKTAKTFGDKLGNNLADCADRVPTATVEKGPTVKGEGADGVAFTGRSFLITQKTAEKDAVPFRVAVLRVGERIAYLLANPSVDFDFSANQWKAIMTRTAQRVSQLP